MQQYIRGQGSRGIDEGGFKLLAGNDDHCDGNGDGGSQSSEGQRVCTYFSRAHADYRPGRQIPVEVPATGCYARRFLEDEDLRQCLTLLYWPADALIALVDAGAAVPDSEMPVGDTLQHPPGNTAATREPAKNDVAADDVAEVVDQQLNAADQYYQQFTQRTVRSAYFRGIGYGLVVAIALFVVLYLFRKAFNAPVALLWSIVAGALGALTSVLSSATFGRIILDRPQGGIWNTFLGAFRPLIGSLFGAAFFVLINAGFLPIKVPTGSGEIALYASIAFLAGFSHRWAQDTLKAAEGRITTPPSPSEGRPQQETAIKSTQQKV